MGESNQGDDAGPPAELRRQFWVIVALLNVALFALALGVLVLVFRARPTAGVGLLAIGLLALVSAWVRYRRVRRSKA